MNAPLQAFGELVLVATRKCPEMARFIHDGICGKTISPEQAALIAPVLRELCEIGKDPDWWPGEGFYTAIPDLPREEGAEQWMKMKQMPK